MIVWGGNARGADKPGGDYRIEVWSNSGDRYDVAADSWRSTNRTNAPMARTNHLAVWTGTQMIVFGGDCELGLCTDGGAYSPAEDRWETLSTNGAPSPRYLHSVVWTGSEMLVWGGKPSLEPADDWAADGAAYNPESRTWRSISRTGAPPRQRYNWAVWVNDRMVLWDSGRGASYDPGADRWTKIEDDSGPPLPGADATAIAEGVFVWDSERAWIWSTALAQWHLTSHPANVTGRSGAKPLWTGTTVLLWGGSASVASQYCAIALDGVCQDGVAYFPAKDQWAQLNVEGAPEARLEYSAIWTGDRAILWGGAIRPTSLASGAAFFP